MSSTSVSASNINKQENGEKKFIPSNEFVLQKHAAFFDRNHDGVVYPWETFKGFRAIGSGIPLSSLAALFINIGLSGKTRPEKCPNLLFPIEIRNIHRGKHGSDTGAYDSEGRFVPSKFEEIFIKHAHTNPDALTKKELRELLTDNRQPKDIGGWIGALAEWLVLFNIAKDKNGLLQKDTVRAVYDGSLFEQLEKEHSASKKKDSSAV
ncbi:probable peroxygenase 4 [Morus notabilis]|uniref:probable peroxygenase 4 n=1 Tax=Morus notabilis TaxID=981085 RepID=UPI000CECE7C1|nr:probable peroxygenase 4 [Morus notabilis]